MTLKANRIYFSKRCEFWHETTNAAVPLRDCSVGELEAAMNELCRDQVIIEFRTSDKWIKSDLAKMTKRIDAVSGWAFSGWVVPVVDGHGLVAIRQCVAMRIPTLQSKNIVETRKLIAEKTIDLIRTETSSGTGHDLKKMIRLREEIAVLQSKLEPVAAE